MRGSKKVLLDTNTLLIPAQFGVDIFEEIHRVCPHAITLCILKPTINELNQIISKQRGKDKESAKLALQLISAKNIIILESDEPYVDQAILAITAEHSEQWIVATQDAQLKKQLRAQRILIMSLRKKKFFALDE